MDMISNLPPPIIETILCLLPIQEAARTCILSKEWRYKWIKIPKLVFNEDTFQVKTYGDELSFLEETDDVVNQRKDMSKRCKLFYAIYQVLLKHEGPIHEFTLLLDADNTCVEIDHIIFHLSKNNTIKKLTLDTAWGYKLPLCIFSLHHLTDLYLHRCDLLHRPTFNGFSSLTNLYMDFVTISKETLLHLLSSSPLLKTLTLNVDYVDSNDACTIKNLFECLPVVENLSTCLYIIKYFALDGIPQELSATLVHLKYLYIDHMCFIYKYGLPFLLLLIRSSPNLEKLKLRIYEDPLLEESEKCSFALADYSGIWLENLSILEIENLTNEKPEMQFMKLILAKSPVLKKVKILLWKDVDKDEELHMSRVLLPSPRASPAVEIIFENGG